jgi:predicted nucleic acid-binding protein
VKVVADSSPLIILAHIGCFPHLRTTYEHIFISQEVYSEVVEAGVGLPGAAELAEADWIEVKQLQRPEFLSERRSQYRLGAGEFSSLCLAQEIAADIVILDDLKARKLAAELGFAVRGTVGLLEAFYRNGEISDLRSYFGRLVASGAYVDRTLLNRRLEELGLSPL